MADTGAAQKIEPAPIAVHATLMEAFCAAQADFDPVIKQAQNTHLKSKYATLDSVLAAVRPSLNRHGLALIQPPRMEENLMMVDTTLVHAASGDKIACSYPVCNLGAEHKVMGAALTYARRYSLLALLGVFPEAEDDDGETAADTGTRAPAEVRNAAPSRNGDGRRSSYAAKNDGDGVWINDAIDKLRGPGEADDLLASERFQRLPQKWRDAARDKINVKLELLAAGAPTHGDSPFDELKAAGLECDSVDAVTAWGNTLTPERLKKCSEEQVAELRNIYKNKKKALAEEAEAQGAAA